MSDIETQTPAQDPDATGGEQPAATNPQGGAGATEAKTVTLNDKDYKELIASRDRANNTNSETDEIVNHLLKKDAINTFLAENKSEFPDVNFDDLTQAATEDDLKIVAEKQQKRIEDAVQKKLMDVQRTTAPVLSPQQRAEEMKKLKNSPDKQSFGRMLELQQP